MERPYVHINFAMTLDGRLANPDGIRLRISCPMDMERVHRLRQELGSVLVGAGTIIADDPKLTVKEEYVRDPGPLTKVVLDGAGRLPLSSRFLRTPGRSIVITTPQSPGDWREALRKSAISERFQLDILMMNGPDGRFDIGAALDALGEEGIDKIMVEGGATTIDAFIGRGLFDILTIYIGPMVRGGGPTPLVDLKGPIDLHFEGASRLGDGALLEYSPMH